MFIINPFAGAFNYLYEHCEGFRNFVNNFLEGVKNAFHNGIEGATNLINKGKIQNSYKPFIQIKRNGGPVKKLLTKPY